MSVLEEPGDRLLLAVRALLAQKGIASDDEIAERIASTDRASPERGAAKVAPPGPAPAFRPGQRGGGPGAGASRSWVQLHRSTDPAFRAAMLADGTAAAESMGVPMRGMAPLGVLENTAEVHHLVVCTLCSCYPRAVLGYPPFWFKSPAYRARAVRDPAGVLAEWGTVLPAGTRIRVVDSTADYRWMVLPLRPAGTDGWDAARLARLLREGAMSGVSVPAA